MVLHCGDVVSLWSEVWDRRPLSRSPWGSSPFTAVYYHTWLLVWARRGPTSFLISASRAQWYRWVNTLVRGLATPPRPQAHRPVYQGSGRPQLVIPSKPVPQEEHRDRPPKAADEAGLRRAVKRQAGSHRDNQQRPRSRHTEPEGSASPGPQESIAATIRVVAPPPFSLPCHIASMVSPPLPNGLPHISGSSFVFLVVGAAPLHSVIEGVGAGPHISGQRCSLMQVLGVPSVLSPSRRCSDSLLL